MTATLNKNGTSIKLEMSKNDWVAVHYFIAVRLSLGSRNDLMKTFVAKLANNYKMLVEQPKIWRLSIEKAAILHHLVSLAYADDEFVSNQSRILSELGRFKHLWQNGN